jgi:cytochrome c-type biogenesis protein CcsB
MKKILNGVFSMTMAGIYTLIIAIAIAAATFIENDFGTATAQKVVYKAWWFELAIVLFGISILVNIFRYKLLRLNRITVLVFHLAFILVIIGAAITRYISYEGLMPIREGKISNTILSENTYFQFNLKKDGAETKKDYKVLFGGLGINSFSKSIDFEGHTLKAKMVSFHPDAAEKIEESDEGGPVLSLVHGGMSGRENVFLQAGDIKNLSRLTFGFDVEENLDVNIRQNGDSLFFKTNYPVRTMSMLSQQTDTIQSEDWEPFLTQHLYYFNNTVSIVISRFVTKGKIMPVSRSRRVKPNAYNGIVMELSDGTETREIVLYGNKGIIADKTTVNFDGFSADISYGSKLISLPFALKLRDFQMERYPGSNSASSYASEVTLIDEEKNLNEDYRIYMNNVLNYRGFRFFQSSYDPDELGTVLSVNYDRWGTGVTYVAYFFLALAMLLSIFSPNTRIRKLSRKVAKLREERSKLVMFLLLVIGSVSISYGQSNDIAEKRIIPSEHAEKFGNLLVQDPMGRTKPINTLSSELIRKLTGRDVYMDQNSDQILLGMTAYPKQWGTTPLIKVSHPELEEMLNVKKYAKYEDFFDSNGYKLAKLADEANRVSSANRGKLHKDVLKVDERVNIMYMIFNGNFLKIFPRESDHNNKWYTPNEAAGLDFGEEPNLLVHNFLPWYLGNLEKAFETGNWEEADFSLTGLETYQKTYGHEVLPSSSKVKAELLYNKLDVFSKLISWYGLVGFVLLILLLVGIFKPTWQFKWPIRIGMALVVLGFAYHTFGLGLRWYISGHAPWSNGYESVIYIAWATVLAGLIYSRRSPIVLGATSILAAWILIVSMMSWADPQITNLVPVLKSYWLTIHVSIITSSYGFLAIGAMLAFINLILIILRSKKDELSRLTLTIRELTAVIESSLIIGLFLLTVGTFLGGIWANESWGRYWGWDAKETWSLVSILVYSFIVHTRYIPGLKTVYAFNLMSFVGFASILMTYFGVNFYLSGLHSYATGDPVPIPDFVYITLMVTVVVATIAYFRQDSKEIVT